MNKMKILAALTSTFMLFSSFSYYLVSTTNLQTANAESPNKTERITDLDTIRELITKYIEENNINANIAETGKYPEYNDEKKVIVEFRDTSQKLIDTDYYAFSKNKISAEYLHFVVIQDGVVVFSTPAMDGDVKGDANCDGRIDMSDAVLIMQSIANPDKYKLTDQGKRMLT